MKTTPNITDGDGAPRSADRIGRSEDVDTGAAPTAALADPQAGCQLCGAGPLERFEVPGSALLWRCPACGLYQYGALVAPSAYAAEYHADYVRRERHKRRTSAVRLARVAGLLDRPAVRMLDIGCSVGWMVEAALDRGWKASGVDMSAEAVAFGRRRGLDCHVVEGTALPFDDGTFDVVTAWHVVEHVEDVRRALAEWRRILRPGGVLAMETPHGECLKARLRGTRYRTFWAPEHTYTFTPRTLAAFCEEADLELLARPLFGRPRGAAHAAYVALYQGMLAGRRALGLSKAFELFARRPSEDRPRGVHRPRSARPRGARAS